MVQVGYLHLLRTNRNFTRLFLARLVSLFGDWVNLLAVLALLRSLGVVSAGSFGVVLILKMLPGVIVAPLAGVFADRYSRRMIMILADLLRAFIVLGLFAVLWFPSVGLVYTLIGLQACLSAFFEPARSAMLPDIVAANELTAANALGAATWSAMLTVGAAVGGLITAYLGWKMALALDVVSYLLSMVFLWSLHEPPFEREAEDESKGWLSLLGIKAVITGLLYVWQRPRVLTLLLVKFVWSMSGPVVLVLTILGENVFRIAAAPMLGVSLLYMARGMGTGLGPVLARSVSRSEPKAMERFITWGFWVVGVFYILIGLANSIWVASVFVLLGHLGGATLWVFSTIRLQQCVPTQVRGRVFAAEMAAFTLAMVVSTWWYGAVYDAGLVSASTLPLMLGGISLVGGSLWLWRGARLGWAEDDDSKLTEDPLLTEQSSSSQRQPEPR